MVLKRHIVKIRAPSDTHVANVWIIFEYKKTFLSKFSSFDKKSTEMHYLFQADPQQLERYRVVATLQTRRHHWRTLVLQIVRNIGNILRLRWNRNIHL